MGSPASAGRRDLNGRVREPGRWERLRARFGGAAPEVGLTLDDTDLDVVAESTDDAVASSVALSESAWRPADEVVLRHVLSIPAGRQPEAIALAAQDGYSAVRIDTAAAHSVPDALVLARVQTLDAVHLSQERSRMASLGSRHGGTVVSWQVLQRPC